MQRGGRVDRSVGFVGFDWFPLKILLSMCSLSHINSLTSITVFVPSFHGWGVVYHRRESTFSDLLLLLPLLPWFLLTCPTVQGKNTDTRYMHTIKSQRSKYRQILMFSRNWLYTQIRMKHTFWRESEAVEAGTQRGKYHFRIPQNIPQPSFYPLSSLHLPHRRLWPRALMVTYLVAGGGVNLGVKVCLATGWFSLNFSRLAFVFSPRQYNETHRLVIFLLCFLL